MKQNREEIWRDVPDYDGYYEVSNLGRVRSLDRWVFFKDGRKRFYKGRIIESNFNKGGYKKLNLSKDSKVQTFLIHQLVAIVFLDHEPNGHTLVCDHIDGDRANNNVENLQIVTQRQNLSTCYRANESSFSSKYVGVTFNKAENKWRAGIRHKGKNNFLGQYKNEEKASKAYKKALDEINDNTFNPEDYRASFTSKFKGVSFHKATQKWQATPFINGKRTYLGVHPTEDEAHQAILLHEAIQPIVKNC